MTTKTVKNKTLSRPRGIVNDESKLLEAMGVRDVSFQGDLAIVGIRGLPKTRRVRSDRQLAVGDTQGSRHVLERGELYDCDLEEVRLAIREATKAAGREVNVGTQDLGPVFVSPVAPTADDLTHPEHGNQGFPAGMVCAVVYQRNLDAEEREQRARD